MEMMKIWIKRIRYNYRDYMLYFYCNSFGMAVFFAFLSVYQNRSFGNNYKIDSSISSNVYAPMVFMIVFLVLFLPYAYSVFLKGRKEEYAVFMTLGMTEREVILHMFLECLAVGIIGLIAGMLFGTILCVFFFFVLGNAFGLSDVRWEFHGETYLSAVKLYAVILGVSFGIQILKFLKAGLSELFQAKYKEERKRKGSFLLLLLGGALFLASGFVMRYWRELDGDLVWYLSLGLMFMGTAVFVMNLDVLFQKALRTKWKISISIVLQYMKSFRFTAFIAVCFLGYMIYFLADSVGNYQGTTKNALTYSPFDLFYVTYQNSDQQINDMEEGEIDEILKKNGVSATEKKTMEFLRNGACNLISADVVNRIFGKTYQVEQGKFIRLFQIDFDDGYKRDLVPIPQMHIVPEDGEEILLFCQKQEIEILFNNCHAMSENTLIIHEADYRKIKNMKTSFFMEEAVMINLDDWSKSGDAMEELAQTMRKENNFSEEDWYAWKMVSKIEQYHTAVKSSLVAGFFLLFVMMVFFAAAIVTIYFKIKAEMKAEGRMMFHLYKVGMTEVEAWQILLKKNVCYFLIPLFLGMIFGLYRSYSMYRASHFGGTGLLYGLAAAGILFLIQTAIAVFLTRLEFRNSF